MLFRVSNFASVKICLAKQNRDMDTDNKMTRRSALKRMGLMAAVSSGLFSLMDIKLVNSQL